MPRPPQERIAWAERKRQLTRLFDMTIEICVVGLQQRLPDSRTCAELQASSGAAADVLKLTGEVWPADQFDQVPKPVVEPGEVGCHSIAQERSFDARFPASRSLG